MASSILAASLHVISEAHQQHQHRPQSISSHMDTRELDAARALLGVSPSVTTTVSGDTVVVGGPSSLFDRSHQRKAPEEDGYYYVHDERKTDAEAGVSASQSMDSLNTTENAHNFVVTERRPRSASVGLDALAELAEKESISVAGADRDKSRVESRTLAPFLVSNGQTSSSDEESEAESMPPPPPRGYGRKRSASNPEGMEKWDSYSNRSGTASAGRRHFVLPASILEEELAEVSAAMREHSRNLPQQRIPEDEEFDPATAMGHTNSPSEHVLTNDAVGKGEDNPAEEESRESKEEEEDASNLSPDELLRRARSRLLEDLLEGKMHGGEKGGLILPHSLDKYKEVYNRNGRIGIYTPSERAAIIAKFNRKRSRRVWNKKIRYNCRKSLADRRLRVKGRFVKRSEQEELAKQLAQKEHGEEDPVGSGDDEQGSEGQIGDDEKPDEDMPDVDDPDAGFDPTDDQPYRRTRRHTIT